MKGSDVLKSGNIQQKTKPLCKAKCKRHRLGPLLLQAL